MPHIITNLVYFKRKFGVVDLQCQSLGHILKERPRRRDAKGVGNVVSHRTSTFTYLARITNPSYGEELEMQAAGFR